MKKIISKLLVLSAAFSPFAFADSDVVLRDIQPNVKKTIQCKCDSGAKQFTLRAFGRVAIISSGQNVDKVENISCPIILSSVNYDVIGLQKDAGVITPIIEAADPPVVRGEGSVSCKEI